MKTMYRASLNYKLTHSACKKVSRTLLPIELSTFLRRVNTRAYLVDTCTFPTLNQPPKYTTKKTDSLKFLENTMTFAASTSKSRGTELTPTPPPQLPRPRRDVYDPASEPCDHQVRQRLQLELDGLKIHVRGWPSHAQDAV